MPIVTAASALNPRRTPSRTRDRYTTIALTRRHWAAIQAIPRRQVACERGGPEAAPLRKRFRVAGGQPPV